MTNDEEQLKDMTIVIASVAPDIDDDADGGSYASTRVFRYDLQGNTDEFIKLLESLKGPSAAKGFIIEGGQLKNT